MRKIYGIMEDYKLMSKLSLDVLKGKTDEAVYMDGDIIVFDGIKELPVEGSLQLDMIVVALCTEGKLQVDINGVTFTAFTNDLLVCPPNVYLNNYMISPNFDAKIIGLSYSALQRMMHVDKDIWNMILHLASNPILHLKEEHLSLIDCYYNLFVFKLKQMQGAYYKDVMQGLFYSMFYELCSIISSSLPEQSSEEAMNMKQKDLHFNRFLKLLADSQGREHSVTAFADKLYITPKYLSTVCKAASGKTALEWIHEYVMDVIVQKLKFSDMSIKEIAEELNFPNISFFGKFVKSKLGVSPMAYRKQFAERNRDVDDVSVAQ